MHNIARKSEDNVGLALSSDFCEEKRFTNSGGESSGFEPTPASASPRGLVGPERRFSAQSPRRFHNCYERER